MTSNKETVLLLSAPQDFANRFELESAGLSICDHARCQGGAGWAGWLASGVLKIRIHRVPPIEIRQAMDAYLAAVEKAAKSISVVEEQAVEAPLPDIAGGEIPWGTVLRQKLTKKFLMLLPSGAFLISNQYDSGKETFAERLGTPETRENVWRRAGSAGATNRLCRVVWTNVDFNGPSFVNEAERAPADS